MRTTIVPTSVGKTKITDPLFGAYVQMVAHQVIPCQWEAINDRIPDAEKAYCIENFRVAAGRVCTEAPFSRTQTCTNGWKRWPSASPTERARSFVPSLMRSSI